MAEASVDDPNEAAAENPWRSVMGLASPRMKARLVVAAVEMAVQPRTTSPGSTTQGQCRARSSCIDHGRC